MNIKRLFLSLILLAGISSPLLAVVPVSAATSRGCFTGSRTSGTFIQVAASECQSTGRDLAAKCYFKATGTPVSGPSAFGEIPCDDVDAGIAAAENAAQNNKNTLSQPVKSDCKIPKGGSYNDLNSTNCGIVKFITNITNALSAAVGVVIVISLTWAGIQYSSSGSDPQKVGAAKHRIQNAILALVIFVFMYAFLTWLVPGGVF